MPVGDRQVQDEVVVLPNTLEPSYYSTTVVRRYDPSIKIDVRVSSHLCLYEHIRVSTTRYCQEVLLDPMRRELSHAKHLLWS